MGFFDDVSLWVGRGMNAADRKTQVFRLQADIDRVVTEKERAFTDLGRMVYAHEGANSAYGEQINVIADIEAQEASLRQQVNALQIQKSAPGVGGGMQMQICPACGTPVNLDFVCCTECGNNLAELKSQFKKCPTCNVYYPADYAFCERCGGPTVTLEVRTVPSSEAATVVEPSNGTSAVDAGDGPAQSQEDVQAAPAVCTSCGTPLKPGALFCGTCGAKV